ncbi:hypothetical protein N7468_009743 [Penicillium chermesinum]|uniref:Uncharacterized protein n=1 Tax=Penicillium chermesinum TaxID=63820 RepID=A0A9W9NKT2_9EURO|nr:uncharacterized protein N7468_009743 [Penicillium chermesinum]KAJ5220539.1 hypothetical protein N7468_009743 [Penicillium chermesinum]
MTVNSASMAASARRYRSDGLGGIFMGEELAVFPDGGTNDSQPLTEAWGLRSGVYTPRQLVQNFASLLDTVVFRLGSDPPGSVSARHRLLENLSANLSTDTREATLRLAEPLDISRREVRDQADTIGKTLLAWAGELKSPSFNPELYLRSPCEGHLLTPSNVDLMFGDRSKPHLMQLFNEYLHQMVLLRDALLPFSNYQDVLIPVGRQARGLRHLEPARSQFLAEILTKQATQKGLVLYARALLAPELDNSPHVGYGFQYKHGSVLPAFLAGGPTPLHLVQYVPCKFGSTEEATSMVFDYSLEDYYSAHRTMVPLGPGSLADLPAAREPVVQHVSIELTRMSLQSRTCQLNFTLRLEGAESVAVDLGQVARGHRYSYGAQETSANGSASRKDSIDSGPRTQVHDALSILGVAGDGLLTAKDGLHIIPANHAAIALAILGKIYPENVVLLPENESIGQVQGAGKAFEPKFVIWGGSRRGGLKGTF